MPKDNKNNRKYTKEERDSAVSKLLPPNNMSISKLSNVCGIPKSTLHGWKSKALGNHTKRKGNKRAMTSDEKFRIVMETYIMSEHDLAMYCRKKGFYVEEVKKWQADLKSSYDKEPNNLKEVKKELSDGKKKIKQLEKELSRKEKALAEAAALLVLQKKFQAFMEEKER